MTRYWLLPFTLLAVTPPAAFCQEPTPAPAFTEQAPTFKTRKTSLSETALGQIAATVVPANLTLQAQAQTKLAATVAENPVAQTLGAKPSTQFLPGCDPKASSFDWRNQNVISPVKDQKRCGVCFIFASTAAFEASWYLQNNQHISVSEQQILDCAGVGGCAGGWHGDVFNSLKSTGVTNDTEVPYTGAATGSCKSNAHPYTAVNWAYVDKSGGMASPKAIKEALCTHGPVVSAVYATDKFKEYSGGVFNEFADEGSSSINHDVLIIGWDDKKETWLIKNSWGINDWGENGFMWIRYRSNYIGFGAAWVDALKIPDPGTSPPISALQDTAKQINLDAAKNIANDLEIQKSLVPANAAKAIMHSFGLTF